MVGRRSWSRNRLKKPRRVRGVAILPSLFTLGNMICGFAAVYYAAMGEGDFHTKFFVSPLALAGYFVLAGILADAQPLGILLGDGSVGETEPRKRQKRQ